MPSFDLNQILSFDDKDAHPVSRIVGIDSYRFEAIDGLSRAWQSYTLVPVAPEKASGVYVRWYIVDFPEWGLAFCEAIEKTDLPVQLEVVPKLTGKATITSHGSAEMGTGHAKLESFTAKDEYIYAREQFAQDDSVMYFRSSILKGPVGVVS